MSLKAAVQLFPDSLVGPRCEILVRAALEVGARNHRRAHAQQREATFIVRINDLVRCRHGLGDDSQPTKWIRLLVDAKRPGGNRRPADAWKPSHPPIKSQIIS